MKASPEFCPPKFKVACLSEFPFSRLEAREQGRILASVSKAARHLALKDSGYNASAAQKGIKGFDVSEFAFRQRGLPGKLQEIIEAAESKNLDYFIKLGKACAKLAKPRSVDYLGRFLTEHWASTTRISVGNPESESIGLSLCLFAPEVLVEVCKHCVQDGFPAPTKTAIETAISRLGLIRAKPARFLHCATLKGKALLVCDTTGPLHKRTSAKLLC